MTLFPDYLQKVKASQAEGTSSSSSTAESQLLQQYFPSLKATLPDEGSSSERKEETEKKTERKKEGEEESGGKDPFLPEDRPVQKSKKRCWICKAKLELAQRELGGCKCGEFCTLVDMYNVLVVVVICDDSYHLQVTCFVSCTAYLSNTIAYTTTRKVGGTRH